MENEEEIKKIFKLLFSKDNELFMLGSSLISKTLKVLPFEEYIKRNYVEDMYFMSKQTQYIFYLWDKLRDQKIFISYKEFLDPC